jgi:hypothetical protein
VMALTSLSLSCSMPSVCIVCYSMTPLFVQLMKIVRFRTDTWTVWTEPCMVSDLFGMDIV